MVNEYCFQEIPRERRFFFFLRCSLRARASSCGSGPLASKSKIPKACPMAFSMSAEKLLCLLISGVGASKSGILFYPLNNRSKAFAENSFPSREPLYTSLFLSMKVAP